MQLVATIFEDTFDAALDAIRTLDADHDLIELRAEKLDLDLAALRNATTKPIILTHRGRSIDEQTVRTAIDANIDFIDVEWPPRFDLAPYRDRIVLSHHDYDAMRDVESIYANMQAQRCAHTKLAATPQNFADNDTLLRLLTYPNDTIIGMGERGLYSRILAPFRGSALTFVAAGTLAAPSQLTLKKAQAIYGPNRAQLEAKAVFAVAGNPAGHSLSPTIHNPLFREHGIPAAYTIASVERFDEVLAALERKELLGLSITTPFKDVAYDYALQHAEVAPNAKEARAVNTLVHLGDHILADNTDVDGFEYLLREVCGRDRKSVAIVGAGGTARAALVAARRANMHVTLFNRTAGREGARPLAELQAFDGEVLINTTPVALETIGKPGMTLIEARYRDASTAPPGVQFFSGLDLLHAQARRQNELFTHGFQRTPQTL